MLNPITLIDGYKLDHRRQFPVGTKRIYSNWTPRSSRVEGQDCVVTLGLQYFLKKYLMEEFERFFSVTPCECGKRKCKGWSDKWKFMAQRRREGGA